MKRFLTVASVLLALMAFASCKRSPQDMANKFCDARQCAYEGNIDKAEKIFEEIREWGKEASEIEKTEYRRIILNN